MATGLLRCSESKMEPRWRGGDHERNLPCAVDGVGDAAMQNMIAPIKIDAFMSAPSCSLMAETGCLSADTDIDLASDWTLRDTEPQQDGDKIFLNFAKRRTIPLVWELDPRAMFCVARSRGRRAWRRSPGTFSCSKAFASTGAACPGA